MSNVVVTELFRGLDLSGVFANAVLGGVIARRVKLDPVGFAVLAVLSGLGGGLIRDTLLQHGTPIALTDYSYMLTAFAGAALAFLLSVEGRVWNWVWPVIDALALGCWAATGAQKTLAVGLGWLPALLLGTITAVGGGARARRCTAVRCRRSWAGTRCTRPAHCWRAGRWFCSTTTGIRPRAY